MTGAISPVRSRVRLDCPGMIGSEINSPTRLALALVQYTKNSQLLPRHQVVDTVRKGTQGGLAGVAVNRGVKFGVLLDAAEAVIEFVYLIFAKPGSLHFVPAIGAGYFLLRFPADNEFHASLRNRAFTSAQLLPSNGSELSRLRLSSSSDLCQSGGGSASSEVHIDFQRASDSSSFSSIGMASISAWLSFTATVRSR